MGQTFSKGESFAYVVKSDGQQLDKNSTIQRFIHIKDGKVLVYNSNYSQDALMELTDEEIYTLGEVSKMSKDELLKLMKEEDKKAFDSSKKSIDNQIKIAEDAIGIYLDDLDKKIEEENNKSVANEDERLKRENIVDALEEFRDDKEAKEKLKTIKYKEPVNRDLKMEVITDGTGNNTKEEGFNFSGTMFELNVNSNVKNEPLFHYYDNKEIKDVFTKYDNIINPIEVFDKNYAGIAYNTKDEGQKAIVTEVSKETKEIEFDAPKDKNVKVVEE